MKKQIHTGAIGLALSASGALAGPGMFAQCLVNQMPWDGVDGQTSEIGTAIEESRTADDFCLKAGYVHEITSIEVLFLTDSTEPDATLQLYHDCNGCPGDLVDCGFFETPDAILVDENVQGERDLYKFVFNTSARTVVDEYGEEVDYPGLWLKGGCYWLSPVGIGDGTEYDRYFWATSGETLIGSIPKTQAGPFKIDGWEQISDLNVDCRNMAYRLNGSSCCLQLDHGQPSLDIEGAVNTTGVGCRNADDISLPRACLDERSVLTGNLDHELCFVSAYIFTNCECERTKLEVHLDECGEVGRLLGQQYEASKCVKLSGFGAADGGVDFDGHELALYRVEFHNIGYPLSSGENYWLSIHTQGSGSFNERGFVAFNENALNPSCTIRHNDGMTICPASEQLLWEGTGRDYAICAAVTPLDSNDGPVGANGCAADYNGDGEATVTDLLTFLDVWFEGCEN